MGLRAYAYLLEKRGESREAIPFKNIDLEFAKLWWLDSMVRIQDIFHS